MTRFLDPTEAVVAAGWLRAAGFDPLLVDYYLCSLHWALIPALGGMGLRLNEAQQQILACPPPERETPSEEDLASYRRIERRRRMGVWISLFTVNWVALLLALALRGYSLARARRR